MHRSRGYVNAQYLKVAADLFAPIKNRGHEIMGIKEGHSVLDVGCGPGIDAMALTRLVSPHGKVFGLDHDAEMIDMARKSAAEAGLADRLEFHTGDAASLPFRDGFFDSCRAERLFMHLPDADRVLVEIIRVLKPGGRIVVTETDWASVSCDSDETDTERKLARFRAEQILSNGYSGRRLFGQFRAQRLTDINVEIFPLHTTDMDLFRFLTLQSTVDQQALAAGAITEETLNAWRVGLEQRKQDDSFFGSVNIIMVAGRKAL
ncbi:MAG: methyltransferase domain-containing protein [Pseudomonadota bacterium]